VYRSILLLFRGVWVPERASQCWASAFGLGPVPLVSSVQKQTVFGSSVFNANTNVNNSFDIGILESKEFYSGLLTPVDLAT
jgi:hypothetical protein